MQGRALEDEIFRLRKLRLDPDVAEVVDEALDAFNGGRELEAEALVEKAAAFLRQGISVSAVKLVT